MQTPATTAENGSKAKIRRPSTSMIILTGVGSQSLRNLCVYRQLQKSPANWWSLRFVLSQKGSPEALLLNHIYEKFWYSKKKGGWVNKLCPIPIEDMQFHLTSNITDFMVCCQATWPLFLLPGILFAHGTFHILSPHPPIRRKVGFKIGGWAAHRLPSGMLCVSPSLSPCLLQSFSKHVLKLQFRLWHTILRFCMFIAVYNVLNFLQYTILQLWT